MEDKHHKFVRIANYRVNKAIDSVRSLTKLSNRYIYSYTEEDIAKIYDALTLELERSKRQFSTYRSGIPCEFKLDEVETVDIKGADQELKIFTSSGNP